MRALSLLIKMMRGEAIVESNYRYLLWREWNNIGKSVVFVMLNPNLKI